MDDLHNNLLDDVHIVLLRPRWARNLGSVARSMKNFGISKLTIVDSQIGSWTDAYQMAVHANDILHTSKTTDLSDALSQASWVVGTSNNPPLGTRLMTPREVAEESVIRGAPTLLFGGEINGLDPAELLRCHVVSTVPTAKEQSSLNLAQAVCVYGAELYAAYELASKANQATGDSSDNSVPVAPTEMLQRLEAALRLLLENSDWIKANRPKNSIAALMQPFYRAQLTEKEVHAWLVALGKAMPR
jgi:TrmH family RNA methyltransferase